jgi:hypothetical protein
MSEMKPAALPWDSPDMFRVAPAAAMLPDVRA